MAHTAVDSRDADATYVTKGNIVRDDGVFNPAPPSTVRSQARVGSLGGSTLVTGATTGPLPAGTYRVHAHLKHLGTSFLNRGLVVEHRSAGDAATLEILAYCPAGAAALYEVNNYVLAANERIRVVTDTDVTNLGIEVDLTVTKV